MTNETCLNCGLPKDVRVNGDIKLWVKLVKAQCDQPHSFMRTYPEPEIKTLGSGDASVVDWLWKTGADDAGAATESEPS